MSTEVDYDLSQLTQERAEEIRKSVRRTARLARLLNQAASEMDANVQTFWNPKLIPAPRWITQDVKKTVELVRSQVMHVEMMVTAHMPETSTLPKSRFRY